MKLKDIPTKYWKIGGIAVVSIAGLFGAYKLIQKVITPSDKNKQEKEEKKLRDTIVNLGADGYVNIRTSPTVDNTGWFDTTTNLLKKSTANPVGSIIDRVNGEDGFYWYKISLRQPIKRKTEGYVREDAVVIQK